MRGRTTIVITHRRDLAMAADRVLVLSDARVLEESAPTIGTIARAYNNDAGEPLM
jgi:ABC-type multidrug transport system fused ATPase/permease subunit